jgi:hypothetical protein
MVRNAYFADSGLFFISAIFCASDSLRAGFGTPAAKMPASRSTLVSAL